MKTPTAIIKRNLGWPARRLTQGLVELGFSREEIYPSQKRHPPRKSRHHARPRQPRIVRLLNQFQVRERDTFLSRNAGKLEDILSQAHQKYLARIRATHPDTGGSHADAARLNLVWENVRRLLQKAMRQWRWMPGILAIALCGCRTQTTDVREVRGLQAASPAAGRPLKFAVQSVEDAPMLSAINYTATNLVDAFEDGDSTTLFTNTAIVSLTVAAQAGLIYIPEYQTAAGMEWFATGAYAVAQTNGPLALLDYLFSNEPIRLYRVRVE